MHMHQMTCLEPSSHSFDCLHALGLVFYLVDMFESTCSGLAKVTLQHTLKFYGHFEISVG